MKKVRIVLIVFFLALLLFSAYRMISALIEYRDGRNSYAELGQYLSFADEETAAPTAALPNPDATATASAGSTIDPTIEETAEPEPAEIADDAIPAESTPEIMDATESALPENVPLSPTTVTTEMPQTTIAPAATKEPFVWPEVDFDQLRKINSDVVGWIYIEGTHINYPIVQANNNEKYLNRLFDGKRNQAGCIFLDYRCSKDFSGLHSILYGHHMKDDSMFADLVLYKDQLFYDEHPVALLITPTHKYRIELFSSYVANDKDDSWKLSFSQREYENWIQNKLKRSGFKARSAPKGNSNILTLSTCTYEYDGAKYLLHGYVTQAIKY